MDLYQKLKTEPMFAEALTMLSPEETQQTLAYVKNFLMQFEGTLKMIGETMVQPEELALVINDSEVTGSIG